jgi:pimeloyl-ACP methyl ester carboxylesterase
MQTMTTIRPFEINIPNEILDDLEQRIQHTRWTRPIKNDSDWDHGISIEYLKELTDYWQHQYNWREQENELNRFNHFKVQIDDCRVHFIHHRGKGSDPIPLLLLHGWPDSFYRFHKIIPMLTDPVSFGFGDDISFDLIVPSLPTLGFSECPQELSQQQPIRHHAELMWRLMTDILGYKHFGIAGGDGGSPLAQLIAIDHPESVSAIYLTDLGWQASLADPSNLTKKEKHYLEAGQKSFLKENSYVLLQSTKPQTLAAGLTDSPVGLAAWILDRFHFWCDGDFEKNFLRMNCLLI